PPHRGRRRPAQRGLAPRAREARVRSRGAAARALGPGWRDPGRGGPGAASPGVGQRPLEGAGGAPLADVGRARVATRVIVPAAIVGDAHERAVLLEGVVGLARGPGLEAPGRSVAPLVVALDHRVLDADPGLGGDERVHEVLLALPADGGEVPETGA